MSTSINLLDPQDRFRSNYAHQVRQTIEAYSPSMIAIGEAFQNAIDAVCDKEQQSKGEILVEIDFDDDEVSVQDNGNGFPRDISLLYLGGTGKQGKQLKGKIGVGIKVTMFSSNYFSIKSHIKDGSWQLELHNAHEFEQLNEINVPDPLPVDQNPLTDYGTRITYRFPNESNQKGQLDRFVKELIDTVLPRRLPQSDFRNIVENGRTGFPSTFSALFSAFLRRYSYVGDVLAALDKQSRFPQNGIQIDIIVRCSNPVGRFGKDIGDLFGDRHEQRFSITPSYLRVNDTLAWIPKGKKAPQIFHDRLGDGGSRLERTDGFNVLIFDNPEEYESLLRNRRGALPLNVEDYRQHLFPYINGILLTIGRIPDFEQFLPGGSRRVMSCNGVITSHDIDLTRGRNQEYVRCLDFVIDLNADLNYGKTHITNPHLVKMVRDFVNEAYVRTLQPGAGAWVGKIPEPGEDDTDVFVGRTDLGLDEYIIRKVPSGENDVIGLFFEMAGRGLFPKYRIFGLSQKNTYDCRAAIVREVDTDRVLNPIDDSKLRIVEFKLHASDVIRDFDRQQKFAREIDLVVAWDIGQYMSNNYAIYDIDQSNAYRASPKKVFPRVSKYIYDAKTGAEVQLLVLEEIVAHLGEGEI